MIVNPQVFSRPQLTNFAQALDPFSQGLGSSAPRFSQVPAFNFGSFASPTYGSVSNVYGGLGLLDATPKGINKFMQNYGLLSNAPAQNFETQPTQPAPQPVPNFQPSSLPPPLPAVAPSPDGLNPSIPQGISSSPTPVNFADMYGGVPGADNSLTMGTGLAPSTGDPVMLAYQDAVKSAQEQRKNGFLGRVVLPGEMSFEQFAEGYNYKLNNPNLQPLTAVGNDGLPVAQPTLGGNVGGDFMGSAQNYFGPPDPRGPVIPMTPEDILRAAQNRNMQADLKPPEVQAYLDNIIQTGGRPTMMAPKIGYSNLVGVLPDGGMVAGQSGLGLGLLSGNGPGGVTLRPTPQAAPID